MDGWMDVLVCGWVGRAMAPLVVSDIPVHKTHVQAKADKLDLVGEDQRRMLEYR